VDALQVAVEPQQLQQRNRHRQLLGLAELQHVPNAVQRVPNLRPTVHPIPPLQSRPPRYYERGERQSQILAVHISILTPGFVINQLQIQTHFLQRKQNTRRR